MNPRLHERKVCSLYWPGCIHAWILNLHPSGFLAGTGAHFTYTDCDLWGNVVADWELPAAAASEMETWTTNFNLGRFFFSWNVSMFCWLYCCNFHVCYYWSNVVIFSAKGTFFQHRHRGQNKHTVEKMHNNFLFTWLYLFFICLYHSKSDFTYLS